MKESKISLGAGIGLLAGIVIGSATDNVGLWIPLGLCFGAGIGTILEEKAINLLLVLAFISFSCMTTASFLSKYPEYTVSQARLLVDTGKCELVSGGLRPNEIKQGLRGSRRYETTKFSELYNAIDTYVELDNANAFVLIKDSPKYAFTTLKCTE